MAYNPNAYLPVSYQQQYQPQYYQPQPQQQQPQPKLVEVIPVDTVAEAEACPMAAGSSGFFFAKDDSFNAVKSVALNGQVTFVVYDRRPPEPPQPQFDPSKYLRKDEAEKLVERIVEAHSAKFASERKEKTENESV